MSGPKFMNWNLGLGGGGAIDLVMQVRQLGLGQALEWLEHRFASCASLPPPQPRPRRAPWTLPPPAPVAANWPQVERYLVEGRKLPSTLLESLV